MRIFNRAHVPWAIFVSIATVFACWLYVGNFRADLLPVGFQLPPSLVQRPSEHRSVGGTPLGLIFGTIALAIFVFAALLGVRKKIVLWRLGTLQRWLRAHIWLTLLTIPLVILHSGFRFGGPMTTLLIALYTIVMVSGIYGLALQHQLPRIMKERLPAETVYEQIPHIRAQLYVAAQKLRDSFKPAPPQKTDAGAPAPSTGKAVTAGSTPMASTVADLSTPAARAKSVVGSTITAETVTATTATTTPSKAASPPTNLSESSEKAPETMGTPTARVPPGTAVPPGSQAAAVITPPPAAPSVTPPVPVAPSSQPAVAPKPVPSPAPKPAAASVAPTDAASEAALAEFLERQILPYLAAQRGDKFRLGNARFSDDTFRFVRLRITETYRVRVDEIQAWCDERRMLDLQVRLHHWLHGWLFVHVPISFLLLMLTVWHAFVTLFYY